MDTRHEQEEQEDTGPVTFRVQADRRQKKMRMRGAAERRARDAAGGSLDRRAYPGDAIANAGESDAAKDGKPH